MSEWQDISTAPRDGTRVDLWTVRGARMTDVTWRRGADVDPERCGPGGIWESLAMDGWRHVGDREGCGCLSPDQFTHWMPIPAPPAAPQNSFNEREGEG